MPRIKDGYKYTLVLDLDETLVHCSTFSELEKGQNGDHEQDMIVHRRPGLDEFLKEISELFEIVIFTAGGRDYARKIVRSCLGTNVDHILHYDHVTLINKEESTKIQQDLATLYAGEDGKRFEGLNAGPESADQIDLGEGGPSLDPNLSEGMELNCTDYEANRYVKDLSQLGRDLKNVIIVDDVPENFGW